MADVSNTVEVFKVSSNEGRSCPSCTKWLDGHGNWTDSVNHVLGHGWRLLHVGGEASTDDQGKSIEFTVAVLGKQ